MNIQKLIAFCAAFSLGLVDVAESQDATNLSLLPEYLPLNIDQKILDALSSTPNYSVLVRLEADTTPNDTANGSIRSGIMPNATFVTMVGFQKFLAGKISEILPVFLKATNLASNIRLLVVATSLDGYSSFSLNMDLGPISSLALNSASLSPSSVQTPLNVAGIKSLRIEVDGQPFVTVSGDYPLIAVYPGKRARYTLTMTNGESAVYTQAGERLVSPTVSLNYQPGYSWTWDDWWDFDPDTGEPLFITYTEWVPPRVWIIVGSTPGSDTSLEINSATNPEGVTWLLYDSRAWQINIGQFYSYIDPSMSPYSFFRVVSK